MTRLSRSTVVLAAGLFALTACHPAAHPDSAGGSQPQLRLVAFDSCADLLQGLRTAAKASVGQYGFGGGPIVAMDSRGPVTAVPDAAAAPGAAEGRAAGGTDPAAPDFSGTNTHEAGVDEPDLVKTDGRRIVTVQGGVLRVVDVASHEVTGTLRLDVPGKAARVFGVTQLLLAGDHALVLANGFHFGPVGGPDPGGVADRPEP